MTVEDLMKPRYKVIADYPGSVFDVNTILEVSGDCAGINRTGSGVFNSSVYKPEKYPHIFRKIEWYEERSIDDMPEYVKCVETEKILKPYLWFKDPDGEMCFNTKNDDLGWNLTYRQILPATL